MCVCVCLCLIQIEESLFLLTMIFVKIIIPVF